MPVFKHNHAVFCMQFLVGILSVQRWILPKAHVTPDIRQKEDGEDCRCGFLVRVGFVVHGLV